MFAGQTKLDEQDVFLQSQIGTWVSLKWRDDLFPPPLGKAYGTHLATFITCPHGEEIRGLNLSWLYVDPDNHVYPVGKPLEGIGAPWFFKYSTLREFETSPLSIENVDFLQLPNLNEDMHKELTDEVVKIRNDDRLNVFRHPGYPDDVSATCGPDFKEPQSSFTIHGAQVWVRLHRQIDDACFCGELLNQPLFHALEKGQQINVHLIKSILVCGKPVRLA